MVLFLIKRQIKDFLNKQKLRVHQCLTDTKRHDKGSSLSEKKWKKKESTIRNKKLLEGKNSPRKIYIKGIGSTTEIS